MRFSLWPARLGAALALSLGTTLWAAPPVPSFRAVEIDKAVGIGYGIAVADVNGDAKPDILLADKDLIAWYENPGWAKHVIAGKLTPKDHVCLAAADIDGDGKCEVAVGAEWNPSDTENSGAVFYLVPGADRRQRWEAVRLPHEPTVHRMRWVRAGTGGFELVVVPLHGRGNKAATGEGAGVKILAYTMPKDPRQPWATRVLDDSLHKTHNFDPVGWDADAAGELLVGAKEGVFLLDGGTGEGVRRTQLTGNEDGGAGEVRLGRLGGQRRFVATVEPMHGNNLVLHLPPEPGAAEGRWRRRILESSLIDGHALACGDFAGLGRDQIAVGWRAMNRPGVRVGIRLFIPVDAAGSEWTSTLVDDNTMACEDLAAADLDGDGRLDLVAAGRATRNLKIYLNQGSR